MSTPIRLVQRRVLRVLHLQNPNPNGKTNRAAYIPLENFIMDMASEDEVKLQAFKGKENGQRTLNDALKETFVAFALPSYSGKTQISFGLERLKPIYFVCCPSNSVYQKIYKNFDKISLALHLCASKDNDELKWQYSCSD